LNKDYIKDESCSKKEFWVIANVQKQEGKPNNLEEVLNDRFL
jgi:hypothetical protein